MLRGCDLGPGAKLGNDYVAENIPLLGPGPVVVCPVVELPASRRELPGARSHCWYVTDHPAWTEPPLSRAHQGRLRVVVCGSGASRVFARAATGLASDLWLTLTRHRANLQLPRPAYLGVHHRPPYSKRLPVMARLRAADAAAEVAVDRKWQRRRDTARRGLLDAAGAHVYRQLRFGGLGDPRADPVAAA